MRFAQCLRKCAPTSVGGGSITFPCIIVDARFAHGRSEQRFWTARLLVVCVVCLELHAIGAMTICGDKNSGPAVMGGVNSRVVSGHAVYLC